MKFVIVTGLSGAGRTQAMRCLEDLGYFCVDNLPPTLIPKFAEACSQSLGKIDKIALVVDIRGGDFFNDIFESIRYLKNESYNYEILFLECDDEVLVKRYKESRRKHPLSKEGRVLEGIRRERLKLSELRESADNIINTSKLSIWELRDRITELYGEYGQIEAEIMVTVLSFGFKYGIPVDSDLVFDVRFLPNPYYIPSLKPYSGLEKPVRDYVLSFEETTVFMNKLTDMMEFLIPRYKKEGKRQLIVSIGCTGGRHRSVALSNRLYEMLNHKGFNVNIDHRDINEDVNRGVSKLWCVMISAIGDPRFVL